MPIVVLLIFAVGVVCGVAMSVARRSGDPFAQRGSAPRPLELERRLARLEQASEDAARAMERLEEGQRFLLSALTERGDAADKFPRALAPGEHPAAKSPNDEKGTSEAPSSPPGERRS